MTSSKIFGQAPTGESRYLRNRKSSGDENKSENDVIENFYPHPLFGP